MGAALESTFVDELPGERASADPRTPRDVRGALHSPCAPTPSASGATPEIALVSPEMEAALGLAPGEIRDNPLAAEYLAGAVALPGRRKPYAANYGGHQFGEWAGQLGDGRAITLGEIPPRVASGVRVVPRLDVQLKGAGATPFSRDGDGRAALRSSLREFVAGEAMRGLGVPTTRCAALTLTGGGVLREHPDGLGGGALRMEAAAIVARVSPTFLRFGSFQLPPSRGKAEAEALVAPLVDYVLRHHMPAAREATLVDEEDATSDEKKSLPPALAMLRETVAATAHTAAAWQAFGFVHGVLNSDNMSVLGLTLDFGPFAFIERFDPRFTPNLSDRDARYCYVNQPAACAWNLARLGDALVRAGALDEARAAEATAAFDATFRARYFERLSAKFGVACETDEDGAFLRRFLALLAASGGDFTNAHRALGAIADRAAAAAEEDPGAVGRAVFLSDDDALAPFFEAGRPAAFPDGLEDAALRARWGDWIREYGAIIRREGRDPAERRAEQDRANPAYVARNHLLARATEAAERRGDFRVAEALLEALRDPFVEKPGLEEWAEPAPAELARKPGVAAMT